MIQNILVALILLACAAYAVRLIVRLFGRRHDAHCGGCPGCGPDNCPCCHH